MKPKIVLGLSGGVDSAVAASLLMESHEVYCLWLDIGHGGGEDAAAVAQRFNLPFQTADIRNELEHFVCQSFTEDYLNGRTPLPCARCNPLVKFPALVAEAQRVGADLIATGHYARTAAGPDGRTALRKGKPANDQSYMLSRLTQNLLRHTVFPLGNYEKTEVRAMAETRGIPVAHKPDSMEICFIPDGDYGAWLEARTETPPPGNFIAANGTILGQHGGIYRYTLGQSRGLGVSGPHRYYVTKIDPQTNTVVLSDGSGLLYSHVRCVRPNWIMVEALTEPLEVTVRLRHSKTEIPAVIHAVGNSVEVDLLEPARAPTPGQLAVFYQRDLVVGSAWIERGV